MRRFYHARPLALAALLLAGPACGEADARANGDRQRSAGAAVAVPPAIDTLAADLELGHTMGDPSAPIAVVEFSDFGCPYCARFARGTLPGIRQEFIDAGLVRWRYVPVVFGFPGGELMGRAAECAADQGGDELFWRVHDMLYERQTALRSPDARPRLVEWLGELGADTERLSACMDAPSTRERLLEHNRTAQQWYVRGTPTFLVNGVPMSGAMPSEFFQRVFATVLDPSGL